ncbi:hypothetical protein BDZ85DRAFT_46719 [Elsinoe ampelina]|uniref:DUF1857-domain-containing protein n=1 Tax=Elsinoe ampelina TaxID=302913 RepID=A0A6A6G0E2_9PEZI|nr:hypothetical protein BDZ85DRAFT_46719 [Elsinoe ampelina]
MVFTFNIAFTTPVNPPGTSPTLTRQDVWHGMIHTARAPHDFAAHAAGSEVVWESAEGSRLGRTVTMADGGVHTVKGQTIHQQVKIVDEVMVEAETLDSGSKTIMLVSHNPAAVVSASCVDLSFTLMYQLRLENVQAGSDQAKTVEKDYPELAREVATSTIDHIREAKKSGKLSVWASEECRKKTIDATG